MVREVLAVAAGGAVGSLARYALLLAFSLLGAAWLPMATLAANQIGCVAIGFVAPCSLQPGWEQHWAAVGIRIGILGGLTTFSSFALDSLRIWQAERLAAAAWLVAAHQVLVLAAAALGICLARSFAPA